LLDFELAEHMNEQFLVVMKTFRMFPYIKDQTWTSIKFWAVGYFLSIVLLAFVSIYRNQHRSATQRGLKPQPSHYRPLLVDKYDFVSGGMKDDKDCDAYAASYVDDYAYRRQFFRKRQYF